MLADQRLEHAAVNVVMTVNESDMTTKIIIIELLEHVADFRVGVCPGFIAVRRVLCQVFLPLTNPVLETKSSYGN